jgi:hypothetical protein
LQLNLQRIDHVHSVMGVASGCVAGILGLTGLRGFGTSALSRESRMLRNPSSSQSQPCHIFAGRCARKQRVSFYCTRWLHYRSG